MKKIGILGGTFNPIHIGHLRAALEVQEHFSLDSFYFFPANHAPHKDTENILSFTTRVYLIKLALAEFDLENLFQVSTHEEHIQGPSYTWYSLQEFQKEHSNSETYFVLGLEDYIRLHTWFRGMGLVQLTHFIVIQRGEHQPELFKRTTQNFWPEAKEENNIFHINNHTIQYISLPWLDISSSQIRRLYKDEKSLTFLLPPSVENFIEESKETAELWKSITE